jgi:CheY-like chemotaxis protein
VPATAVTVNADASRLQQVVWNLVSNAVKFTGENGTVLVELTVDERVMTLRVCDNGIGIAPDFLPYVFDRFRQADSSTSRTAGGLGLGLAIVKHIVELHGGTIGAASDGEGRGATFTVTLPLAGQPAALPAPGEATVPEVSAPPAGAAVHAASSLTIPASPAVRDAAQTDLDGVRCLIVDDDDDTRYLLRAALEDLGSRVTEAASAAEALPLAVDADVVVADLAMPGEDGYTLIRRIRELPAARGGRVPAIAVTAHATEGDRDRALAAGFDEHLAKPVEPARVVAAIHQLLTPTGSLAAH